MSDSFQTCFERQIPIRMGRNTMKIYTAILLGCNTGRQPCFRELMTLIGAASKNAVMTHVKKLRRLGLVADNEAEARAVKPLYRMEVYVP